MRRSLSPISIGCSSRQATHHEANTLTSETAPLRLSEDRPGPCPCTGGRLKTGTGLPMSADGTIEGLRLRLTPNATTSPTKAAAGTRNSGRRLRLDDGIGSERVIIMPLFVCQA